MKGKKKKEETKGPVACHPTQRTNTPTKKALGVAQDKMHHINGDTRIRFVRTHHLPFAVFSQFQTL